MLGLAIMIFYLHVDIGIYGTIWIMLIAYVTRFMPYGLRYNTTSMLQIHKELEESAAMSGASWTTTFRRIVLPLLKPGLLAGWIYMMIVSIRELSSSILLYSPGTEVLSIVIWELWENGQYVELSALGVMLILALFVLVLLAQWLGRQLRRQGGEQTMLSVEGLFTEYLERARRDRAGRRRTSASTVAEGQALHAARPERLRQDDDAALDRRPRAAARRRDLGQRPRRVFSSAQGVFVRAEPARLRHGVPVVRDLAAHDGVRERRLSAAGRATSSYSRKRDRARSVMRVLDGRRSSTSSPTARRPSSPAASSSASRSRARW